MERRNAADAVLCVGVLRLVVVLVCVWWGWVEGGTECSCQSAPEAERVWQVDYT